MEDMQERLQKLEYIISGNGAAGLNERVRKIEEYVLDRKEERREERRDRKTIKHGLIVGILLLCAQIVYQIINAAPK